MTRVRRTLGVALGLVLLLAIFAGGWLAGRLGIGSVVDPASLTDLERQFTERMRDVTMIGSFTVAGREDRTPRADRYEIAVFFYGDRYAGTWQHGRVGGHMSGRIEKQAPKGQ